MRKLPIVLLVILALSTLPYELGEAQSDILRAIEKAYEYFATMPGLYEIMNPMTQEREVGFYENILIGMSLSFCLENAEFMPGVSEREKRGKELLEKIVELALRSNRVERGWRSPFSGGVEDTYVTSHVVLLLVRASKIVGVEKEAKDAAAGLSSLQDKSGGWGAFPRHPNKDYRKPDPGLTAVVLHTLLEARIRGIPVSGDVISKAIAFLKESTKKTANGVYWSSDERMTGLTTGVSTGYALASLCSAKMLGYDVDEKLLRDAKRWVVNSYSQFSNEWDKIHLAWALSRLAFIGMIESKELKMLTLDDIILYVSTQENGLLKGGVFRTALVLPMLFDYYEAITVYATVTFTGKGVDELAKPPIIVEGGELTVFVTVENGAEYRQALEVEVEYPNEFVLAARNKPPSELEPGEKAVSSFKLKHKEGIQQRHRVQIVVWVKRRHFGVVKVAYTTTLDFEVVKNSKIALSKQVSPSTVDLGDRAKVRIFLKNTGDVSAKNIMIREELYSGAVVADFKDTPPSLFVGGFSIAELKAGEEKVFTYEIELREAPPGKVELAKTTLMYTNALGEPMNITAATSLSVKRPLLKVEAWVEDAETGANLSSVKWGQDAKLKIKVCNIGNSLAKDVSIDVSWTPQLEAESHKPSTRLEASQLEPGDCEIFEINVSGKKFLMPPTQEAVIVSETHYLDAKNNSLPTYYTTAQVVIRVEMPKWIIYAGISLGAIVALLAAALWARREASRRIRRERRRIRRPRRASRLG
ncbi:MAG: hypothetical protein DRN99_04185 [Thermoproteota archaeon]|nr:MAG: hypothetical protein DRN99_04185 [Candidatus Korarchaeota archaeon]